MKALFESDLKANSSRTVSKEIWIFSDMMNETKEFPMPELIHLGPRLILEKAEQNGLVVPLAGYGVHVCGASTRGLTPQAWIAVKEFWTEYFIAAGWAWRSQSESDRPLTRAQRREMTRGIESRPKRVLNLRGIVYAIPVLCVISLVWRIEGRLNGRKDDPHGPDRGTLLMNDWAVRRSDLDHWLEQQTSPQVVFVRYSRWHNVNNEWVYNHPDIMGSRVIWARDLGAEHNKLLLNLLADRTAWLLEADAREPQLVPYAQAENMPAVSPQEPQGRTSSIEPE